MNQSLSQASDQRALRQVFMIMVCRRFPARLDPLRQHTSVRCFGASEHLTSSARMGKATVNSPFLITCGGDNVYLNNVQ